MKEIKLTQNKVALIDNEDYDRVNQYKWCAAYYHSSGNWYAMRGIQKSNGKRRIQLMHRLIMDTPQELDTDHRSHNTLDNRKCNLRICTRSENHMNRIPYKNTSSKFKGVSWHKQAQKWMAYIKLNNKRIYLGLYTNEIKAALTYNIKAKHLFGKFAYLNFQEGNN